MCLYIEPALIQVALLLLILPDYWPRLYSNRASNRDTLLFANIRYLIWLLCLNQKSLLLAFLLHQTPEQPQKALLGMIFKTGHFGESFFLLIELLFPRV